MTRTRRAAFLLSMMAMSFLTVGKAADDQADKNAELAKLKAQLEQQQKQIEQLSKMLMEQRKVLDQVASSSNAAPAAAGSPASTNADAAAVAPAPATPVRMLPNMGEVASSTPMLPPPPPSPAPHVLDPQVPAGEPS